MAVALGSRSHIGLALLWRRHRPLRCYTAPYQRGDTLVKAIASYWHLGSMEGILHDRVPVGFVRLLEYRVRRCLC